MYCFHVTDLHGRLPRYEKLWDAIRTEKPDAVFIGGDILPGLNHEDIPGDDFIQDFIGTGLRSLAADLGSDYPSIFVIPGNDDGCSCIGSMKAIEEQDLWKEISFVNKKLGPYQVYGYPFVPPTPFLLKDFEKYDVSRYVDPGCVSPEEGYRTMSVKPEEIRYGTIQRDLEEMVGRNDVSDGVFLFHSPPHQTLLDRADLDGKLVDYVQPDVHVGSIAVRRFIVQRQPHVTLHGHVHESTRLTGSWKDRIGRTVMFNAAHDGPELALIRFHLENPEKAERILI